MNVLAPLSGISLPTLDYLISVMDSRQSFSDFTIVLRFNQKLDFNALTHGASSGKHISDYWFDLKGNRYSGT